MTTPHQVNISVRGEASRLVEPDLASCAVSISAVGKSVEHASAVVEGSRQRLVRALAELGGKPATSADSGAALAWSVSSLRTGRDGERKSELRYLASVSVNINLRDFGLLSRLTATLISDEQISLYSVAWLIDDDNPAWRDVRADAIAAALAKGADYATALGGRVIAVDQIADQGLLAGDAPVHARGTTMLSARAAAASAGSDGPSLDPVPQQIQAVIEARLAATTGDLDAPAGS